MGQTVLATLMPTQILHQIACSVALLGEGLEKRTTASAHLDARRFNFSQYATGTFQAATPVLELKGSESE